MGQNKALLPFGGQSLLAHALATLNAAGLTAQISGGEPELARFAPLIPDHEPGLGPLSGIVAALRCNTAQWAVFLPVDLPLLPPSLLRILLHHANDTHAPVTLVSLNGFVESFPVVLRQDTLSPLQSALDSAQRGCLRGFRHAAEALGHPLAVLAAEDLAGQVGGAHPPSQWLLNVNRPEDFQQACQQTPGSIP